MITAGTTAALLTTIEGTLLETGTGQSEKSVQTSDFLDGAALVCPNIQITNDLTYMDWLSRLPLPRSYVPKIQVIQAHDGAALIHLHLGLEHISI